MQKIILTIKDDSKIEFLMELLKQLNFIEIDKPERNSGNYNLFKSAGIWKSKEISAEKIREEAWSRGN